MGIHVGCCITYEDGLMKLNDRFMLAGIRQSIGGFLYSGGSQRLLHKNKIKLPIRYTL